MGLPPNWQKYTTDDGKEYFHNSVTNITQWDSPEEPNNMEVTTDLPPNWKRFVDDETGERYYHNTELNLTRWDTPTNSQSSKDNAARGVASSNEDDTYKPDLKDLDLHSTVSASSDIQAVQATKLASTSPVVPLGTMSSMSNSNIDSVASALVRNVDGAPSSSGGPKPWYLRFCTCISIEKLQQYFDLSTGEFIERLKLAGNPLSKSAVDLSEKPDFYGPFWIVTTAVVFLSGTANFGNILIADEGAKVVTDWNLVYISATMVYGALIFVPLLVSLVLRFSGLETTAGDTKLSIAQFICVWGYSFTWLIPCALLCIIPSDVVKWIIVSTSFLASCLFVRNNLWQDMGVDLPRTRYVLIALLFGSHGIIYFMYRVYFFAHTHASPEVIAALELQKEKESLLATSAKAAEGAASTGTPAVIDAVAGGGRMLLAYMLGK